MSVDEAIQKLRNNESESSLGRMIDSYMIKILEEGLGKESPEKLKIQESKFDNKNRRKKLTYKFNKARLMSMA